MKIVLSLGGSLIFPDNIDHEFLCQFKKIIVEFLKKGHFFAIVCGGGALARNLQTTAAGITKISDEEKDWLGIEATKINAYYVKALFSDQAYEKVISDPTEKFNTDKKIIICSGWKPGRSTDYDAVLMAKNIGASKIINMSNIDYVYDSDPRKNKQAKPLKQVSWKDFQNLVGDKWIPGLNMPFDPIAAREAAESKLKVIIIGKDLENLRRVLDGTKFEGSVIN